MRGKAKFETMDLNLPSGKAREVDDDIVVKGFDELEDDIEIKGLTDFSKSPILNAVKKLRSPNGSMPNVVPDDLKAGIDKFSKINRLKTAENYSGVGPAKNTIMANRQVNGDRFSSLRPEADTFRGSQKIGKPVSVNIGSRRPDSYDKPIQKSVDDLIVEK